ncbi:MAG: UDP-N-acetylmuramoyl-L-alanine--D-glutamate ligase [Candidatus Peribacter sp.]|jgi:UDP-N-acetylmuramoyl-L-alanine---L-glutamate ligase|nr:UDP-N-acetylmuramoyl-L-alanine--D-glutamate ligase [Candidatus Peribacter sp.]MBT4392735.1 UDP-N-acetylmuramoyl-L-alanine--D-glutamate ligase [Candidatus Peribacter sp.]MBT4600648.1 UDP-N-acetylmuramoyl-L-alanine--D-glutamate ligase [Candidatus Peribacter sp.]MBT5148683.1 UDP-N-acetylmuramoyl-L-alanine--D-glutamate ligase [Candidatus Peribacter sp.]MBT5637722.1 UDP-N-acetylmuramoyl-L-alanine--D-glutamate ligase [Candidatus Peribacter sp.]
MNIRDLNGKSVAILGALGREGVAMQEALKAFAPKATVELRDMKDGPDYLDNLDGFDVVIKAPGIPPHLITNPDLPITNSTQIFLDSIDPQTTVIGVTGSKGKSTVSSLITAILTEAGKDVQLVGNIGDAAIAYIEGGGLNKFFVQEFSSYQLMQVSSSPKIAVVTSFFPEHLDYHGSLEEYKEAKKHLTKFQAPEDIVFYYGESEGAKEIADASVGTKVSYTADDSPIAIIDTKLVGTHNLFNIAAAAAVARHIGISDDIIIEAVRNFDGLPHRLKDLGKHHGTYWVDDAISTTPESTIAAIHALTPNVKTIILGGQDRGNDFAQLGEVIAASGIENVIVMGESGPRIKESIDSTATVHEASSMKDAVASAKDNTSAGSICLLSPASPSYGMFKDFEEKGDAFKEEIIKK